MKNAEREQFTRMRARELAASGEYENWHMIDGALCRAGLRVPDDQLFREELDLACQRATGKPTGMIL